MQFIRGDFNANSWFILFVNDDVISISAHKRRNNGRFEEELL